MVAKNAAEEERVATRSIIQASKRAGSARIANVFEKLPPRSKEQMLKGNFKFNISKAPTARIVVRGFVHSTVCGYLNNLQKEVWN